ncbi:hypothetical protein CQW23_20991 [Capsicum baccatum]|uniref:F-box domain-containing protein n=1 Tax=Capsicum baccatum TaxID=33114 RepID=A0A2G2VWR3_CAPBA|nr:hypothetical protein CQW23_20991 [Capsicum baccatum]
MKDMMEKSSKKPDFLGEGIDRISNLPDDILHNILSYLYMFDVVKLSMLSKRWNYIWKTMPYLNFDINHFGFERIRRRHSHWVMAEKFKECIDWVLISQSANNLVCFKLCCGGMFDEGDIYRWIRGATTRNVQELVLSFRLAEPFELSCCFVTCESLRVLRLTLHGSILKLPNHFGFNQLKLLHLVEVELSNETSCLFSECPVLQKLILRNCSFGTTTMLDIASKSLVYVAVRNYVNNGKSYSECNIKISCPNLKVLKYRAPKAKDIILENLFSIEVVQIYFFDLGDATEEVGMLVHTMIKNVRSTSALKLCIYSILGLHKVLREVRNSPVTFYRLKSLNLTVRIDEVCMRVMMLLLKCSPNLEVLDLFSVENYGWDENWMLHDPNETIVCLESHLKSIKLNDFKHEENEMELLRFSLKNARVLEKLTIVWDGCADISEEASEEVSMFPRASSDVVVKFLDFDPN